MSMLRTVFALVALALSTPALAFGADLDWQWNDAGAAGFYSGSINLDVGVRLLKTLAEMPGAASCSDLQKQVEGVHAREMEWFQARATEVDVQRMGFPARFR